MPDSFVKKAPEIAEEILRKAASLPGPLSAFSRDLLTKEASDEREKLALPKRMTLDDLRKVAASKGADLPKVASAPTSEFSKVAAELRAVVERGEKEIAEDILATAAALVMQKQAAVSIGMGRGTPGVLTRVKAFLGSKPAKYDVAEWEAVRRGQVAKAMEKDPTSPVAQLKHERQRDIAEAKAQEAASRHRSQTAEKMIAATPAIGLGVGTPLAAAALLKSDKGKKEEVKIYK